MLPALARGSTQHQSVRPGCSCTACLERYNKCLSCRHCLKILKRLTPSGVQLERCICWPLKVFPFAVVILPAAQQACDAVCAPRVHFKVEALLEVGDFSQNHYIVHRAHVITPCTAAAADRLEFSKCTPDQPFALKRFSSKEHEHKSGTQAVSSCPTCTKHA